MYLQNYIYIILYIHNYIIYIYIIIIYIYYNVWIRGMEQRYGTDPSRGYGTGVWNGGMERVRSRSLFRTSYFDLHPYMYIYIFFRAQICESPSYCNHIYIYTIYIQIYIYISIIYWYIYIYMPCTVSRAATPSPSSNRPLGLPLGVDGNNLTKLVRLSYNNWSLCSASMNQIQSFCLFSNKAWSGSVFTLKDLSVLLLQRSQFLSEMMTKGPKARSQPGAG